MDVQGPAGRAERICCLVSRFKQSFSSDYWIASLDSPGGGIRVWLTVTLKYGCFSSVAFGVRREGLTLGLVMVTLEVPNLVVT